MLISGTRAPCCAAARSRRARAAAPPPRAALRDETPEQARERRLRESATVEERVHYITDAAHFHREMAAAGGKLVVIEAQADGVCQTGLDEEPELQWKGDREAALRPCEAIKHTFQRTARECSDVVFLQLQAEDEGVSELCDELGIDVLPTLQFWRNGTKLWEAKGALSMDQARVLGVLDLLQDLGEGVLFFNGSAANGVNASDYVAELATEAEIRDFVASQRGDVLTVVDFSLPNAAPCIRVFPAVLALARSFKGYAAFGRVVADEGAGAGRGLLAAYGVVEVPTFVFFKGGKEVERHVGSSRGDLMGKILEVQGRYGVSPPPPPPGAAAQRRVIQRRVTRKART